MQRKKKEDARRGFPGKRKRKGSTFWTPPPPRAREKVACGVGQETDENRGYLFGGKRGDKKGLGKYRGRKKTPPWQSFSRGSFEGASISNSRKKSTRRPNKDEKQKNGEKLDRKKGFKCSSTKEDERESAAPPKKTLLLKRGGKKEGGT